MKVIHARSLFLLLSMGVVSGSCGADDDTTRVTNPNVTGPGGVGATAGSAVGGGTPGGGGTTGAAAMPGGGGTTGGATAGATTGGGGPAGGAISAVTVEMKPCEQKVRSAGKTIPDFMIVLDRSQSMKPDCMSRDIAASFECGRQNIDCKAPEHVDTTICGGTKPSTLDRWTPAVAALKSLTKSFETKVNFGLTIFPGPPGMPVQGQIPECAAGTQRVPVALNTATAIGAELDMTQPTGRTPTGPTLDVVLKQIQAKKTSPDDVLPPQYVLLVTDGAPTCPGTQTMMNQQAHQATITAIDALAKAGVKTFVIGYDASVDPALAAQLTEYAKHGGTNNFFAVQDGPSLIAQFTSITSVVAECSYLLDKKPDDKNFVLVELDGNKLALDDPNGWIIDDRNVTIQGEACTTLRDGSRAHTLSVTVECVSQVLR